MPWLKTSATVKQGANEYCGLLTPTFNTNGPNRVSVFQTTIIENVENTPEPVQCQILDVLRQVSAFDIPALSGWHILEQGFRLWAFLCYTTGQCPAKNRKKIPAIFDFGIKNPHQYLISESETPWQYLISESKIGLTLTGHS